MMKMTTKIAIGLVHTPWLGLIVVALSMFSVWRHLADGATTAVLAKDIQVALYVGNLTPVLYAIGVRLHLLESKRIGAPRPWVWPQVRYCSLGLVPLLPFIWPIGGIVVLTGIPATRRLIQLNTEPPDAAAASLRK